ncbi:MAG: PilZ domain-containing protein [Leptospiraceae bacterium]|nr:PilZ domain-containing protein [Leptospiraceae bacterium]
MSNQFPERRQSERIQTQIQGKIDNESCVISNLSRGGLMLLSTFAGKMGQEVTLEYTYQNKYFEKKGVIKEINSFQRHRKTSDKKSVLYGISISFIEEDVKQV